MSKLVPEAKQPMFLERYGMPASNKERNESSISLRVEGDMACASLFEIPNSTLSNTSMSLRKVPCLTVTRPGPRPYQLVLYSETLCTNQSIRTHTSQCWVYLKVFVRKLHPCLGGSRRMNHDWDFSLHSRRLANQSLYRSVQFISTISLRAL